MRINQKLLRVSAAIMLASAVATAQATPQTSYYVYDESGHVIGEYDSNGNAIQEHIYLGDRPVAVVQGQTGSVGYVTADQLNTPRAVADQSATLEWSWTSDPFGNGQPTGSLTYNLRFPGQYYDAETGHNYNYFRDYDPSTGRYIESDPFGLLAGVNTYVYSLDSPSEIFDSTGTDGYVMTPEGPVPVYVPGSLSSAALVQALQNSLSSAAADVNNAGAMVGGWAADLSDFVSQMTSPGNVGDTAIESDYGEAVSEAKRNCKIPPDRCEWLAATANNYSPERVKRQAKKWGCRGSRWSKGGSGR